LGHCIVTGGKWWEKDENVSTKKRNPINMKIFFE
jgi:hypothetical protein